MSFGTYKIKILSDRKQALFSMGPPKPNKACKILSHITLLNKFQVDHTYRCKR